MNKKTCWIISTILLVCIFFSAGFSYSETFSTQVTAGSNDAEEHTNGIVDLASSDLELGEDWDYQVIGIRFEDIAIPQGATITSAYVQFQVDETSTGEANLLIEADAADSAAVFTSTAWDISSREPTTANVSWTPDDWPTVGEAGVFQQTPDISLIIQEIVERSGWAEGNAIALIITGSGKRVAESYNGNANGAPRLYVEYTTGPVANHAPVVDAGPDLTVYLPENTAVLSGTVTDDGLPDDNLIATWSQVSGPSTAYFETDNAPETSVTLGTAGIYVLELMADDGELTDSDTITVTVLEPDTTPPSIPQNVNASAVSSSEINISWEASTDNIGVVQYQLYRDSVLVATVADTSFTDTGLAAATEYAYTVAASDAAGNNSGLSDPAYATTDSIIEPDTTPPSIPQNVNASAVSSSEINISWEASTDNIGVVQYQLYRDSVLITTGTDTSFTDTGLAAATEYAYTVAASDAAGNNSGLSDPAYATTDSIIEPDTTPPSIPQNVNASAVSSSEINISWEASTDNIGVVQYQLYRDSVLVATVADTSFTDTGLAAATEYAYTVAASDAAGNNSGLSDIAYATTDSIIEPDTTPPSIPQNVNASAVSSSEINISWEASTDNIGVVQYQLYRDSVLIATGTATSFTDTGLAAATEYAYTVAASDAAGNNSGLSDPAYATTENEPPPGAIEVIEVSVSNGIDDAEEHTNGIVDLASSDLELGEDWDYQVIGIRFEDIAIPQGATITSAYVQFQVDETSTGEANLLIEADAADSAAVFTSTAWDISSREPTTANVSWTPDDWPTVGEAGVFQQTPDISLIIQEIVERSGWAEGNAIALIITGSGKRVAESYNGNANGAPRLYVEYTTGPVANHAPVVDAGPDLTVYLPENTAVLSGTVTDDGLPDDNLIATWSQVSGPSTAYFETDNAPETSVTLGTAGIYVLELMADDGELTDSDTITVTVLEPDTTPPSIPQNVNASAVSSSEINISWEASTDNIGVVQYQLYRDSVLVATVADTSFTDTGLAAATEYAYTVAASDAAGNNSGLSDIAYATTDSIIEPDTTPPSIPQNVNASAVSSSEINISWEASTDNIGVVQYQLYRDSVLIATGTATSFTDTGLAAATEYAYTVAASDAAGNNSGLSDPAYATTENEPPPGAIEVIEVSVSNGIDDAEEHTNGIVDLASSDLELGEDWDYQVIGIRFEDIAIPQGATITSAYVQFQVDETSTGEANLLIEADAADSAAVFTSTAWDISSREPTTANVSWTPDDWPTVGEAGVFQQTPDISLIIQEIVERSGWAEGNAIALIITGSGKRVAESYNGNANGAPRLYVEYTTGPVANHAPVIDAGPDLTVYLPENNVMLSGTVTDDGLPDDNLIVTWSQLSGPSTAYFESDNAPETSVTLGSAGIYVLELMADDGELTDADTITVTVLEPDTTPPSIPQNVNASAVSSSEIDISWDASTDNIGVVQYQLYRDSVLIATVTDTSFADTGLAAATEYAYTVEASDSAGNNSGLSDTAYATTENEPPPGTIDPRLVANPDAGEWTLVVIPDTQHYSQDRPTAPIANMYTAFNWLVNIRDQLNIKFVQGLGDIVEIGGSVSEWELTSVAWNMLYGEIPFIVNEGNHDLIYMINEYFPVSNFSGEDWWGGNYEGIHNSYQMFTFYGEDYLFINVQSHDQYSQSTYNPGALQWANDVISAHPDYKVILGTHDTIGSTIIRDEILLNHDNIVMSNAGHQGMDREVHFLTVGPGGGVSQNFMCDYQDDDQEIMLIRYYVFKPLENSVYFYTYSPVTDTFEEDFDSEGSFTLEQVDPVVSSAIWQ